MASFLAPVRCPINHLLIREAREYLQLSEHWHDCESLIRETWMIIAKVIGKFAAKLLFQIRAILKIMRLSSFSCLTASTKQSAVKTSEWCNFNCPCYCEFLDNTIFSLALRLDPRYIHMPPCEAHNVLALFLQQCGIISHGCDWPSVNWGGAFIFLPRVLLFRCGPLWSLQRTPSRESPTVLIPG